MKSELTLIFGWISASIFALIIQWKFFTYHFLVIIPAIVIGTSIFFAKLNEIIKSKYPSVTTILIATLLMVYFLFAFKPYYDNYSDLVNCLSGQNSLEQTYIKKGFTSDSAFMISKTLNAVRYVKNNTTENDLIYVWGFDPLIYYLTGRHCVSRFIYDFPLYWKGGNSKFRYEFMNDLKENNPKLILIAQRDPLYYISGFEEDSKFMLVKFPEFKEFIESKYSFQTQIDDFYFYKLND